MDNNIILNFLFLPSTLWILKNETKFYPTIRGWLFYFISCIFVGDTCSNNYNKKISYLATICFLQVVQLSVIYMLLKTQKKKITHFNY